MAKDTKESGSGAAAAVIDAYDHTPADHAAAHRVKELRWCDEVGALSNVELVAELCRVDRRNVRHDGRAGAVIAEVARRLGSGEEED